MPEQLSGLLIHATNTPSWLLKPVKVFTSPELYPDFFRLPAFLNCSGILFFDSHPFSQLSQSTVRGRLPLVTYPSLCSTYVTYKIPWRSPVPPTQPLPKETKDYPSRDKYFKHVPPLTYLIYFSKKGVYMAGSF